MWRLRLGVVMVCLSMAMVAAFSATSSPTASPPSADPSTRQASSAGQSVATSDLDVGKESKQVAGPSFKPAAK